MELTEVFLIIGVLGTVSSVLMYAISRFTTPKTAKKAADATSASLYRTIQSQMEDVVKLKDTELKSRQNKINYLEKQLNGSEEEEDEMPIPPELLEPIAKKLNMNPQQMATLIESPQVKKLLKGNKDLIPMLLPMLGNLGGQNQQQPQITGM